MNDSQSGFALLWRYKPFCMNIQELQVGNLRDWFIPYSTTSDLIVTFLYCKYLQVEVVISLSTSDLNLVPVPLDLSPMQVSTPPQVLQQVWNVKKEVGETSALRDEYGRQLKDFIDRNTVNLSHMSFQYLDQVHQYIVYLIEA